VTKRIVKLPKSIKIMTAGMDRETRKLYLGMYKEAAIAREQNRTRKHTVLELVASEDAANTI
jgi:hypothetical protein